jgi:asparagine synthase (glutamine-hydrolysing)
MCGIAGFLKVSSSGCDAGECLRAMISTLSHRGPDDEGQWFDSGAGLALGHRRLSVIDPSPAGHQPMASASARYRISFNGEIYNFRELRKELEAYGHRFRGNSDTEVMLAAFEQWGVEEAVKRFMGMFAFALWDSRNKELHLVRDRLGEKPLYYGWMGKTLLFGSELKALRAHPDWRGEINRDALATLMRHNYIPAPRSIYNDICKVMPGTIVTVRSANDAENHSHKQIVYWSALEVAEDGVSNPFSGSETEATDQLDSLLRSAIKRQMVADVPLGAFLSGGVDSSTVVALMQAQSVRPIRTFTIGFAEGDYNEAVYAKAVAECLGTAHTELYVTPQDAMEAIPRLAAIFDEPFSDSSQIPTFLVSQLARRDVTVTLSGDGADELFYGYPRYQMGRRLWSKVRLMPPALRRGLSRFISEVPMATWNGVLGGNSPLLSRYRPESLIGDRLHSVAEILKAESRGQIYRRFISHCKEPGVLVPGSKELTGVLADAELEESNLDFNQWMMLADMLSYLPDDILVKLDRASMAASLESRAPFLDHRVVEFALRLPMSMKYRSGSGKWILRKVLSRYLPTALTDRPKKGFAIPIGNWLRGALREWAEDLLNERRLRESFFNPAPIRLTWADHLSGRRNWQGYLWNVLIFQQWLDQQRVALRKTA